MADLSLATLSVQFAEEDRGRIILQQLLKRFNGNGDLVARCFFSDPVEYVASVGTARAGERLPQFVMGEGVKFVGSSSATLKYPGPFDVVIDTSRSVLMRKVKSYGRTIFQRVYVDLIYDPLAESVVTADGLPVYGAASVTYQALYQLVYYRPEVDNQWWRYAGVSFGLGTLFAFNENAVATLDMELDLKDSPDWIEYARVFSKIVLDAKGVWEFPPNWKSTYQGNKDKLGEQRDDYPADGEFPNTTETVDGGNSFVDERVHLMVEVDSNGRLRYGDHNNGGSGHTLWEQPYLGNSTYQPDYEIRFAEPPGGSRATSAEDFKRSQNNRTWRTVFAGVNKQRLIEKIQDEYPGAVEE
jgi:hypothetical protein